MSFSGAKGYITKPKPGAMLNPLHPISQGLVGYWLFNEGSGSQAYDISGNDNHGTLKNMSQNAQDSGWSSSNFGGGLQVDNTNDYVEIADDNSLHIGTSDFSLEAWIKHPGVASAQKVIIYKVGNAPNYDGFRLVIRSTGALSGTIVQNNNWINIVSTKLVDDNQWHHVVATFKRNGNAQIYIDGSLDGSGDITANSADISHTNVMAIGKNYIADTEFFGGIIDSVSIHTRRLLPIEVKQLSKDPFCNLLQVPIQRYSIKASIINLFQRANFGADLYNGTLL